MTDLPPDPFAHPVPVWDHVERGALVYEQLLALPVTEAVYAVLVTLTRADLAALVLHDLTTTAMPDWRDHADRERETAP